MRKSALQLTQIEAEVEVPIRSFRIPALHDSRKVFSNTFWLCTCLNKKFYSDTEAFKFLSVIPSTCCEWSEPPWVYHGRLKWRFQWVYETAKLIMYQDARGRFDSTQNNLGRTWTFDVATTEITLDMNRSNLWYIGRNLETLCLL